MSYQPRDGTKTAEIIDFIKSKGDGWAPVDVIQFECDVIRTHVWTSLATAVKRGVVIREKRRGQIGFRWIGDSADDHAAAVQQALQSLDATTLRLHTEFDRALGEIAALRAKLSHSLPVVDATRRA